MQVFQQLRGAYGGFLNGVGFAGICTDPEACPAVFRPFSGRFPAVFRSFSGRLPAVFRPLFGRFPAAFLPFPGHFRPAFGRKRPKPAAIQSRGATRRSRTVSLASLARGIVTCSAPSAPRIVTCSAPSAPRIFPLNTLLPGKYAIAR